jgi:hypothetical protein
MNVASSMAVALAERVEKSGGPKAGLVAWRTVASNAPIGDVRARAALGHPLRDRRPRSRRALGADGFVGVRR